MEVVEERIQEKSLPPPHSRGSSTDTEEWVTVLSANPSTGCIKESYVLRQLLAPEKFTMPEPGTWGPLAQSMSRYPSMHAFCLP